MEEGWNRGGCALHFEGLCWLFHQKEVFTSLHLRMIWLWAEEITWHLISLLI
jgi:hypothetical protein